ncbi:hypothetical protein [Clostridium tertium]|uniref:hypothetical protein n=1 Tax=Clostridium tertium TaxID=1559 RepID=UPI0024B39B15|nr:hypothetical protein [Clostridium tertium]MDI9218167.1 hypothetical protein [Clostridium tertium]
MLNNLGCKGMIFLGNAKERVRRKAKSMALKKKEGAKGILEEKGLLIVGVVLLFIFRDVAIDLIQTLATFVGDKVKALFSGI